MKKDNKILKPIIASLGAILLIISGSVILGDKKKIEDDFTSNNGSDDKVSVSDAPQTKLSIAENKCRGCGKCVRIDAEHFALDIENRVAIVVSTDNLDSENLVLAANNCQEGAIIIS